MGENPAVGSANARLHRLALAKLDWLVVRDLVEIETASFWHDAPEIETGELAHRGHRHRGVLPARGGAHREGRHVHEHPAPAAVARARRSSRRATAAPTCGSCYHLGRKHPRAARALRPSRATAPLLDLTWDYPTRRAARRARRRGGAARDQRLRRATASCSHATPSCRPTAPPPAAAGSTAGCFADGVNQAARRKPGAASRTGSRPSGAGRGRLNRRILYNRASADPEGRPWSERKRYVWWDEDAGRWTGDDVPDFKPDMRPDYVPPRGRRRRRRAARRPSRSSCRPTAAAGCSRPRADRRPAAHALRAARVAVRATRSTAQQANPTREALRAPENPYNPTHGEPGARSSPTW